MKIKNILLVIAALFAGAATTTAQNINGKVLDSEGNSLPGAAIYWAETNIGVSADIEGNFTIYRVKGYDKLVGSFTGYENDTIRVDKSMQNVVIK
ncbi:MAG: carboxypeptidase-like regulatory domain-containing protein, partial [Alistipes sp.]|nr:carboxypeptidase-like regulatory domain-containing protein [Alistipes sp.]